MLEDTQMPLKPILVLALVALSSLTTPYSADSCKTLRSNPAQGGGSARAGIHEPGSYCLSEDLHSRFGIPGAHRYSEATMIEIWTSDVDLDLKGHTIGRGILFRDSDKGAGIRIVDDYVRPYRVASSLPRAGRLRNITIRNGTLRDFRIGVRRIAYPFGAENIPDRETGRPMKEERFLVEPERKGNVIYFREDNIRLENIIFENVTKDVELSDIRLVPMSNIDKRKLGEPGSMASKDAVPSASGERTSNPPCGGTDYFGRPLRNDTPCDREKAGR